MKKLEILIGIITFALILSSCKETPKTGGGEYGIDNPISANGEGNATDGLPQMTLEETEFNFGTVIQGEKVTHKFNFKNTGESNLVINSVKPSCGCTISEWTREPIRPGDNGYIKLTFDSSNKKGSVRKTAEITTNEIPNKRTILIICDVVEK